MASLGMVFKAASKSMYAYFIKRIFLGLRKTSGISFNARVTAVSRSGSGL
jgi:hypothetical protein